MGSHTFQAPVDARNGIEPPPSNTDVFIGWLVKFASSLSAPDESALESVLTHDGTWRDLLAADWDIRNFGGRKGLAKQLRLDLGAVNARDFEVRPGSSVVTETADADGVPQTLTAFFTFRSDRGPSSGFVRLARSEHGWQASALMTQLDELEGHPELIGSRRGVSKDYTPTRGRITWAEARRRRTEFLDEEPQVVVVGAGHCGLGVAARLEAHGVSVLVLEKHPRVGDNWRSRYSLLSLHDVVNSDHLPYMTFSSRWKEWTPKDKFANLLEHYAEAQELNVWTGITLLGVEHHEEREQWTLEIRREDGSTRTLRPRHLVMATGLNGLPKVPDVDGREDFQGDVMHAAAYKDGSKWSGKKALVVGSGVTGHEIVQDLWESDVDVTMLQRSRTHVINIDTAHASFFANYFDDSPYSTEEADMLGASMVPSQVGPAMRPITEWGADRDKETLDGLRRVGFELDSGPNGGGVLDLLFTGRNGYYLNTGASQLLIDGRVGLRHGEIKRLTATAAELSDGSIVPCDLVLFATGYGTLREQSKATLGDIVDRCGLGFGEGFTPDGEFGVSWRRSGVPGLWFMTGGLPQARPYSKVLALQIKAVEAGVSPWDNSNRVG